MPRRVLEGKVTSDKMDKTVTVSVERRFMHPKYKKYIKKSTKYAAHDESNSVKTGEIVQIIECAPISKRKTWTVVKEGAAGPSAEEKAATKKAGSKADAKKQEQKPAVKKTAAKKAPAKKAAAKKSAKKTTKKTEDKK